MARRKALLLGATGLVGGHCLRLLHHDALYESITILTRRRTGENDAKIVERIVDFERLEVYRELFEVDDIFCCLGTTIRAAGSQDAFRKVDYSYPVEAARCGSTAGARQFLLVSSLGASRSSRVFYTRVKGETEEAVRTAGMRSVGIFRPSMLLGDRQESRPGEAAAALAMRVLSFAMVGPARRYRPIDAVTVARAMVKVARGNEPGVRTYESDAIQRLGSVTVQGDSLHR